MNGALQIEDLHVSFKTLSGYVDALSGVDLAVNPGETVGLVGESGCGKSVTAQAVMRLLPPSARASGGVFVSGTDMLRLDKSRVRELRGQEISMIFQEPMSSLNPVMRIGDQIAEPLRMHGRYGRRELRERVIEIVRSVGIPRADQIVDEYPHQLSGGMRQRVMIGIAIACSPKILVADEPTTALDVTVQAQILDLLRELQEKNGMGLLLITHDLGVVASICQRVAVMYAGRIVEECSVEDLFYSPKHPYTQGLLGSLPDIRRAGQKLTPIQGSVPSLSRRPAGCGFAPRCPYVMDVCRERVPSLDTAEAGHKVRCWLHEGASA